jgi:hypothetical protein
MANILFPTSILGMMVLPLMIFHQIQLMVCAVLARRYKRQTEARLAQERPAPKPNALSSGADQLGQPLVLISSVNAISSPRCPAGN